MWTKDVRIICKNNYNIKSGNWTCFSTSVYMYFRKFRDEKSTSGVGNPYAPPKTIPVIAMGCLRRNVLHCRLEIDGRYTWRLETAEWHLPRTPGAGSFPYKCILISRSAILLVANLLHGDLHVLTGRVSKGPCQQTNVLKCCTTPLFQFNHGLYVDKKVTHQKWTTI